MGPGTTSATAAPHKDKCAVLLPQIESKSGVLHSRYGILQQVSDEWNYDRHFSSQETGVVLFLFPPLQGVKASADVPMQYIQSYGFLLGVASPEAQAGNVTRHGVCVC